MNWSIKGNKNRGYAFLLLAILLFFAGYSMRLYNSYVNDPEHIYTAFQKNIFKTELDVKTTIDVLSTQGVNNPIQDSFWKLRLQGFGINQNPTSAFFVFNKDTLIFWSDHEVILPTAISRQCTGHNFVLKLKNGWYGFHSKKEGTFLYLGCYLIHREYPFQNEYLKNQFPSPFDFPEIFTIDKNPGKYPIRSSDGTCLFNLNFSGNNGNSNAKQNVHLDHVNQALPTGINFILFILGSIFLICFFYRFYPTVGWFAGRQYLIVISFFTSVMFLRGIQFYFRFPEELYNSELFGPSWYSSSVILPSLGDLSINILLLFGMSLVFFRKGLNQQLRREKKAPEQIFVKAGAMLLVLLFFQTVEYCITDLVTNSSLPLNLQNISGFVSESGYGLFVIVGVLWSLWLISAKIFNNLFSSTTQKNLLLLSLGIAIGFNGLLYYFFRWKFNYQVVLFFILYLTAFWYLNRSRRMLFSVQNMLFFLCFFALFATSILNLANQQKENGKLNLLAVKLSTRRNPVTEVKYDQLVRKLAADSVLKRKFQPNVPAEKLYPDSLIRYLKEQYFKDYWRKYNIQITLCDSMKDLKIQPQGYLINCNTYFREIIRNYGEETGLPGLVFLDYGYGKEYYLAKISGRDFGLKEASHQIIFIEINLKNTYPDPGYPGLLMDQTRMDLPNLSDYSYGLFENRRLVHAVGKYSYNIALEDNKAFSSKNQSFSDGEMTHFQYKIDPAAVLLISRPTVTLLTRITPFSYLFILFSAITLIVSGFLHLRAKIDIKPNSLRNRLHLSLTGILVVALLAIGIVQMINITAINRKKNKDNLRERAWSVMVEVGHKFSAVSDIRDVPKNELEDFLIKLSNVFFTDVNFYDERGILISSSRQQIVEEGLVSERMEPRAYYKLAIDHKSSVVQNESIGSMQFSSAYLPFYNEQNTLLGYVNLPYFSRQDEIKKEISLLLVTFINIYILLILCGIFITILISNYITAPLALLAEKISGLRLGRLNDKIYWHKNDEIGQLATEYNRMVDELEKSAGRLAQSERESAWREMARQVAHEIKNPLTPMKLSVQHLQKAWNDKAPDWDQRLARFTNTLVGQIDTLSAIASDFSDFSKMPPVVMEKIDLNEIVRFVLSLYEGTPGVRYEFQSGVEDPIVLADRTQLVRVLTNLLNNAVQAIGDLKGGLIRIRLSKQLQRIILEISDNGAGMSVDRGEKIFQPEFTTKTGGMGLGLAIVKGIIEGLNGEISFTSEEQKGTTFIIKLPVNAEVEK